MAANKGMSLTSHEERQDDVFTSHKSLEWFSYKVVIAFYSQRIERADFWGGESELLVLSKLCKQPITVYIPEREHKNSRGSGFIPIAEYGAEYCNGSGRRKARQIVRLLYSGRNHYDLLV
ncbi:OVARIAN TUMOR DOMAIN-containing deubiquitinating enzyme 3-like protein [Drosera capensis]